MSARSAASNGKNPDVAFLVFGPLRERRKNNSFEGNGNLGALVIEDTLERAGIDVGRCSPETAHEYRLVLVSFNSTYDMLSFYQQVAMLPGWQPDKRVFKVLAGGFGMQNPTVVRQFIDYAAFGRAHTWIVEVVDTILGGGVPQHESLMHLPDIHPVTISQSPLYNGRFAGKTPYGEDYQELFTGCPLKCKFCHYTWARKYDDKRETRGSYVQESLTGGGTPELTWDQLFTYGKKAGRVRVAIDGFSERLRYIYGKRITNQDLIGGINAIGQYKGNTVLLVYNICNMPGETDIDRNELYETLKAADPSGRVVFVLHSTPFRPSLATPMQWERVTLFPDWSKVRSQVIDDRPNFRAVHSFTLETPWSHLMTVVVERATPETDAMFHNIAFSPTFRKLNSTQSLKVLQANYDLSPYLREYDPDERHPAWFLSSYTDNDVLKRIARKMRRDISKSVPGHYVPVGKSIVEARRAKVRALEADLIDQRKNVV